MTNKNPLLLVGGLVVAVVVGYFLFFRSEAAVVCQPGTIELPAGSLALEGDPWSGYARFRDPNFLKGTKYSWTYAEQLDQAARACGLTEGKTNFIATTADQYLKHRPAGQIVAITDDSRGADALALNTKDYPYLKSMAQISRLVKEFKDAGKRPKIAYTMDSPSEFLMIQLAAISEHLKLSDFDLVPVGVSTEAYAMLQKDEVQLAVIWEPDTAAARAAGYTIAMSSKDVPYAIIDVLVASDAIIEKNPEAVQLVVDEFYAAHARSMNNLAEYKRFLAMDGKFWLNGVEGQPDVDAVDLVLAGIKLYSAAEALEFATVPVAPLDETILGESLTDISSILALNDPTIKVTPKMVNTTFMRAAAAKLARSGK